MATGKTSALDGVKVVDFSRFLPGAYASWIAADTGADVIRIEHPRELAKQEAMLGGDADPAAALRRRARPTWTRNKRSLMINPGSAAARPVLEKLIAGADVLIEDYRPGVLAAMGTVPRRAGVGHREGGLQPGWRRVGVLSA